MVWGVIYALLCLLLLFCLLPFYLMVIDATHTNKEIITTLQLLPGAALLDNIRKVTARVDFPTGFSNSLFVAVCSTLLTAYFGALTAYGFSKYRFKGKNILFVAMLMTMMLPEQVSIVGYFKLMGFLKLTDTHASLILPSLVCAGMAFWLKQYCDAAIPDEIIESGRIDGAGELHIFHRLILPLMAPAIACMAIFTFIHSWNSFLKPLILMFTPAKFTLPLLMTAFTGQLTGDYGAFYCGMSIATLPIIVVYLLFSRYIISGLTLGAVKT
jgi:multiple sugar transport system permease protein